MPTCKQVCTIKMESVAGEAHSSGLEVRWEDDSKTLQSLVFLKADVSYTADLDPLDTAAWTMCCGN